MTYSFDFSSISSGLDALRQGLAITFLIALCANAIGVVAGFGVGLLSQARSRLIRMLVSAFVEFFRCTPPVITSLRSPAV